MTSVPTNDAIREAARVLVDVVAAGRPAPGSHHLSAMPLPMMKAIHGLDGVDTTTLVAAATVVIDFLTGAVVHVSKQDRDEVLDMTRKWLSERAT